MTQNYYKTDRMIELETYARSLPNFHEIRRVAMAANIVNGHLIVGCRHHCPIMCMQIELLGLDCSEHDILAEQGFVDQWGIYMCRREAWSVAERAGQIKRVFQPGVLFSECYL